MSEGEGGRASVGIGIGIFVYFKPTPSLGILKFWQGIVEVVARVAILVGLMIVFISCSVAQNEAAGLTNNPNIARARAAAGWTIFLGVIGFIYGVIFLLFRFLNPGFMTAFRMFVLIEDAIFNGVLAVLIMTGAASMAAGADYLNNSIDGGQFDSIIVSVRNALGAAAFFAFVLMFMYIFLTVWIILYLVFKWDVKSGGGASEKSAPV